MLQALTKDHIQLCYSRVNLLRTFLFIGGQPSTAFCLLLRLLTLRCSEKQMKLLLDHVDSPYIRGVGFLYLRYVGDPKSIWGWIEPYLYDDEPIAVAATSSKNKGQQKGRQQRDGTVGDFVRRLFSSSERDFYGTMLPRLPIQVERDLQVKLLFAEKVQERAKKHISNRKTMDYFKTLGSRVMALYGDDENPITWYEGVVDRVLLRDEETRRELKIPKFIVTFPEYGNTETVTLGEMEMPGVSLDSTNDNETSARRGEKRGYRSQSEIRGGYERDNYRDNRRDYNGRGYSDRGYRDEDDRRRSGIAPRRGYDNADHHRRRDNGNRRGYLDGDDRWKRDNDRRREYGHDDRSSRSGPALPSNDDLYEEVRRRERENVTARGNEAVVRRSQSVKASLTGSAPYNRQESTKHVPAPSNPGYYSNRERPASHSTISESSSAAAPKKRSMEEIAAQQEKKRKLMARYG